MLYTAMMHGYANYRRQREGAPLPAMAVSSLTAPAEPPLVPGVSPQPNERAAQAQ
jgi:hypothetical protein